MIHLYSKYAQLIPLLAGVILISLARPARADELLKPTFGGFIDTYYAYSSNQPKNFDRSYTTQAARHNEFNLNLGFLEANLSSAKVRGRLALQAGTSVQSNYAGEPTQGTVSGPLLSRFIQEAYAGYQITPTDWLDGGIFFSHIGLESFISRDNASYTRSLVAEFSPYYQSGLRLTHQFSETLSVQALILNGWQNISESNPSKAWGTQIAYLPNQNLSLTYNTFFGNELGFRHFHDIVIKAKLSEKFSLAAQADLGFQSRTLGSGSGRWYGYTFIARQEWSKIQALVLRFERYVDDQHIIVSTPGGERFRVYGASLGYDRHLTSALVWRNEVKKLFADQNVFLAHDDHQSNETLWVSSLGLTF